MVLFFQSKELRNFSAPINGAEKRCAEQIEVLL